MSNTSRQTTSAASQQPTGDAHTRSIDRSGAQALTLMLSGIPQKRTFLFESSLRDSVVLVQWRQRQGVF